MNEILISQSLFVENLEFTIHYSVFTNFLHHNENLKLGYFNANVKCI